ncbi:MAG: thioredoxin [Limisphaerales bacterium]|jgi:thioredoxin 1|nr:MAG: thioredoxin [Limisphaerales bacterium]|tara:strand:+ start:772 stop:1101 length:330 start_codon:yes stop_codon:yes gene_type:complete
MASDKVATLTADNFDSEVLQSTTPVLVDFWAEWCGPCKMIGPIIDQIADENDGKAKVGKVNIDDHQQLAVQYNVQSIPTLIVFKNGQIAEQKVGGMSKADLQAMLDSHA